METFTDYKRKFEKIDWEKITKETLKETKELILDLQRDQWYDGERADGKMIETNQADGKYHPLTIEYKKEKGQKYDVVTLKDTGKFYKSLKAKTVPKGLQITGSYDKELPEWINDFEGVFGLNDDFLYFWRNEKGLETFGNILKSSLGINV